MPMTLTNLIPDAYRALEVVSRELVGFIPSVTVDAQAERIAAGQTVRIPNTPKQTTTTISPGSYPPNSGGQALGNESLTINRFEMVPIQWTGEEQKSYELTGLLGNTLQNQFAQAFRALANYVEADLAGLYVRSSRAYGSSGSAPFASTINDAAEIKKLLDDLGAPMSDRSLIVDTNAGMRLRKLTQLTSAYAAGTTQTLNQGTLVPLFGLNVRESAQIKQQSPIGAGTGYTVDTAGALAGATTIPVTGGTLNTTGIIAGDIFSIGSEDSIKYVVNTGLVATSGNLVIAKPGLKTARSSGDTLTAQAAYTAHMAFSRDAIVLATRLPAAPKEGDAASDVTVITDPFSGISFEIRLYPTYRQVHIEVALAWGCAVANQEHLVILQG